MNITFLYTVCICLSYLLKIIVHDENMAKIVKHVAYSRLHFIYKVEMLQFINVFMLSISIG